MDEKDKKAFLEDFKKADVSKKLDMWYFALEQIGLWDEIQAGMADVAQDRLIGKRTVVEE